MNYGKNNTRKREKELTSKGVMIREKFNIIFFKTLLVCLFAVVIIGSCAGFGILRGVIDAAPEINLDDATPTGFLSTVLDTDGKQIATLVATGSNRVYATIDEIPLNMQHAFVAIEDERFYEHNGIDLKGILRAGIIGITSGHFSEGASTITQQLLKNNVFTSWTSESSMADKFKRKIQEQFLAIQLEKKVSKDWILENYLNTINLGQNTLGVQAASRRYFNKDAAELTLSECSVIAAITQNPSRFNPISNPDKNQSRRKKVLDNMLEFGYISQEEYNMAIADDVYSRIQVVNTVAEEESVTSYFVDELTDQVIQDLIDLKGYTETQAYKALYNGGLTIYSTQNSGLQAICDAEINNPENYPSEAKYSFSYRLTIEKADGSFENYSEQTMLAYYQANNAEYNLNFSSIEAAQEAINQYKAEIMKSDDRIVENGETLTFTLQPEAALTLMNQETGEVVALVGGRGDKKASRILNRATDTSRQPGSTFKVLAAYAPALDSGGLTLASVQDDAPYSYENGTSLRNYDNSFRGFTTIREAITSSINIVTVKTLTEIGTSLGYSYLHDFGFTTLVDDDNNQALALGGITKGVTNLELTSAYATIANYGTYIKPRFYTKILDHDGNVLIDNTPQTHGVLKDSTAWLLTNAMEDVITKGTGTAVDFGNMAIAGKTGTTTKNRDALFAGYTPYYTCVVWGGYDDNTPQESGTTSYPKAIWRAVMGRVHENLEYKDFIMPDSITTATICKKSGKLVVAGLCDSDPRGSMARTEYFAEGSVPTKYCDHHVSVSICAESGMLATDSCPERTGGVYITGGSPGSADGPYLASVGSASNSCPIHGAPEAPPPPEGEAPPNPDNQNGSTPEGGESPSDGTQQNPDGDNPPEGGAPSGNPDDGT